MMRVKVFGPNIQNEHPISGVRLACDTYHLEDFDEVEAFDEHGFLVIELPPYEGAPADGNRPARKPTGPTTVTYLPGQVSKVVVTEMLP